MNASDHLRPSRHLPLVVAALLLLVGCGAGRGVTVPGVAAAPAPTSISVGDVDDMFTPVTSETTAVPPASTVPIPTSTTPTTSTSTTSTTTSLPARAAGSDLTRASARHASIPVLARVSGWPAFDLQLQTLLTAGSDAVSAAVMHDGEIVHEVALGARTAAGESVQPGDRFRVASISKVITSITVLRLAQAGQLDLDAPVGERLAARVGAAPSDGVARITTRHLLTHRSGIAQYENLMFRRQVESCPEAAAAGLGRSLERSPGTTLRYSNLNFCLLGLLVEDVTGRPYADVVHDELLAPLGIEGMRLAGTFDVQEGDVEHRSDADRNYMEVLGAAGSWIASPTDVVRVLDSLDLATPGWKPLGPEMVSTMTTITVDPPNPDLDAADEEPSPPPTRGYGMGLMIFGPGSFGHTGTLESTHAMTGRRPDGYTWAITVSGDHPASSRELAVIFDTAFRYAAVA